MRRYLIASLLVSIAACAGTDTYGGYSVSATYASPDLVYAAPGVQVLANWNEPVFYADNYYWWNNNGRWYRSTYYDRGWVIAPPPRVIAGIRSPSRYRYYRPPGYASRGYNYNRNYNYNRGTYNRNYNYNRGTYNRNYDRGTYNRNYDRGTYNRNYDRGTYNRNDNRGTYNRGTYNRGTYNRGTRAAPPQNRGTSRNANRGTSRNASRGSHQHSHGSQRHR